MSNVKITHGDTEITVYNPEFVDVLLNVNEVAVDGRIFSNVSQVTYSTKESEDEADEETDVEGNA